MGRPRRPPAELPQLKLAMERASDYQWCAARLKALADPDRLRIVNLLLRGPKNVSELSGEMNVPVVNVSHHLKVLRQANVLQTEKRGKFVIYSVHPEITCEDVQNRKSIDLGCCRFEILQPTPLRQRPTK
ncbi:MAG TPA: metalloregulator ArsR/SmtB family transcription factor [Pirellulales bacterium]|nr:metalloregulator ArsR/SmtB family transcription factor [Pirellulales bacterium]